MWLLRCIYSIKNGMARKHKHLFALPLLNIRKHLVLWDGEKSLPSHQLNIKRNNSSGERQHSNVSLRSMAFLQQESELLVKPKV